uniref:Uncharacterized protein n=1 Tax=Haemonchus contortus TaxID=6289 RepID=W6NA42_HAECO
MVPPLSLMLFGAFVGLAAEYRDSNNHPFNNGAVLPDAIKKLFDGSLFGIYNETFFYEKLTEVSKFYPEQSERMKEHYKKLIAMKSNLEAMLLSSLEEMQILQKWGICENSKININDHDEDDFILKIAKALHRIRKESREIAFNLITLVERLVNGAHYQESYVSDEPDDPTSSLSPQSRDNSDVELIELLEAIETILTCRQ